MNEEKERPFQSSASLTKLLPALIKFQKLVGSVIRDAKNPHFKSDYATLAAVRETTQDALAANDLAVTQTVKSAAESHSLVTTLFHNSGEWLASQYPLVPERSGPQAFASCLTYARRNDMLAILGLAPTDDDGNEASKKDDNETHKPMRPPKSKPSAPKPPQAAPPADASKKISRDQQTRLFDLAHKAGWKDYEIKTMLSAGWQISSSTDIPVEIYNTIIERLEAGNTSANPMDSATTGFSPNDDERTG